MSEGDPPERPIDDVTALVDRNGLVKLFANRARARILATVLYADEPLTVAEIADGAGIYRSVVYEALEGLEAFEILETEDGDDTRYRLRDGDELVAEIRTLAELTTERFYDDPG